MSDTVREQIIQAVIAKLGEIGAARGYQTELGGNVRRADPKLSPDDLPACNAWPGDEQVTQEYGLNSCSMQMKIEAIAMFSAAENPSVISEQMLGDIVEAMTGYKWTISFASGGTDEPEVGDTVEGVTSSATGYIESITLSGGSWAGGDAAGALTLRRVSGLFQNGETVAIDGSSFAAQVSAAPVSHSPASTTTGALAERIGYTEGDTGSDPDAPDIVTGAIAIFAINYKTKIGNPFST